MKKLFIVSLLLNIFCSGVFLENLKASSSYELYGYDENWVAKPAGKSAIHNRSDRELLLSIDYSLQGRSQDGSIQYFLKNSDIKVPPKTVAVFTPEKVVQIPSDPENYHLYRVTDFSMYKVQEKNTGLVYEEKEQMLIPGNIDPMLILSFTAYEDNEPFVKLQTLRRFDLITYNQSRN